MKKYGIIVEDENGNRLKNVRVELTDFTISMDMSDIFDSGMTDEYGLVYLNPMENMKKRKVRVDKINDMFKEDAD